MKTLAHAVLAVLGACAAFGQPAPSAPAFEVASIKPAAPQPPGRMMVRMGGDPGRVDYSNVSLRQVLSRAYGVKNYQISGPSWIDSERFDITATVPDGVPKEQIPAMLQTLLAERFKMTVRHETKERSVYALVVGKNGPKLKKAEPGDDGPMFGGRGGPMTYGGRGGPEGGQVATNARGGGPGGPGGPKGVMMMSSSGHLEARRATMASFSDMLSTLLGRPVVDKTGIQGEYDIVLNMSMADLAGMKGLMAAAGPRPDGVSGTSEGGNPKGPGDSMPAPETTPSASIFTAVQQLGLKLESRKAPIEQIVIEKAEKVPTEN